MHAPVSSTTRSTGAPVVRASSLTRTYGWRRAVDDVTFELAAGECLALFGPNGAGKTTLLRMLAGLMRPTSGECVLLGAAMAASAASRASVGLISHASMLYGALSVRANVEFTARLYGLSDPAASATAALESMKVLDRQDSSVQSLSRGLQQRVSIARAIVHGPMLLLCDEPYTGLDEVGGAALTNLLRGRLDAGAAMIVVTHNLAEGLSLATRVATMIGGKFARLDERSAMQPEQYAAEYRALLSANA